MAFLDTIRKQPREKKIRLIWICAAVTGIILLIAWIMTAGYNKQVPKDTTLFDTVDRGVNDLRQNYNKPIK